MLTFLWIQVSVQWVQLENSKVGQCLRSRSRLLHSFWNVCLWPQLNCKCRAREQHSSVPSLLTVIAPTPPPPSDVIYISCLPTYRKMFERNCGGVLCPAPNWLQKESTGVEQTPPISLQTPRSEKKNSTRFALTWWSVARWTRATDGKLELLGISQHGEGSVKKTRRFLFKDAN